MEIKKPKEESIGRKAETIKTKKPSEEEVFDAIKTQATSNILLCLSDLLLSSKSTKKEQPEENICTATFTHLRKQLRLNPATLSTALQKLDAFCIIEGNKKTGYAITDLGLFIYPFLKIIKKISTVKRKSFFFDEKKDPMAWIAHATYIINNVKEHGELLIATRWLDSFPKNQAYFHPVFQEAYGRHVDIKIVADIKFPEDMKKFFQKSYGAKFKLIPSEVLENPPKILKPLFLDDFSHVMIADRTHWLYLNPHKRGELHSGKIAINDPAIAGHLADVFESFWDLSTRSY